MADGFYSQHLENKNVVAFKWRIGSRHPAFDICDMYAKADMFNLGAGVYPKDKVPPLPAHPHCLCRISEVYRIEVDMSKQADNMDSAVRDWLDNLPSEQQDKVLDISGAKEYEQSGTWQNSFRGWRGLQEAGSRLKGIFESGIIRNKVLRGTYPTSQKIIDDILEKELNGVRFTRHPIYNTRYGSPGTTKYSVTQLGTVKISNVFIGKQYTENKEDLIDTLLYEELECRILLRRTPLYNRINVAGDTVRHKYINSTIERFFKMKGWDYGLVTN